MAAPAISGVVALISQAAPGLTVKQMKNILRDTATPLTDKTYPQSPNNGYGFGLVQASAAVEAAIAEEGKNLKRINGKVRYDTAINVSRKGWDSSETVVLARGYKFADALAGVPLAYKLDAPILLTPSDSLYHRTLREIKRLRAKNIIILGGTNAISESITKELKNEGLNVKRIAGERRFETAALIAEEVAPNGTGKVVITNGMLFPDALSVAPYAAREGIPILLATDNQLPEATKKELTKLKPSKSIVVGGPQVINKRIIGKLPGAKRISGLDRYKTNIAITNYFGMTNHHMYVATGKTYADALSGAVLAAKKDSGILLVKDFVPKVVSNFITEKNLEDLTILGGQNAVNPQVEKILGDLIK